MLRYRTTRQLGFFDDHDELYWNVTGNGWDFPIDAASATVALPGAIAPSHLHVEALYRRAGRERPGLRRERRRAVARDVPRDARARAARRPHDRRRLSERHRRRADDASSARAGSCSDNGGVLVGGIGLLLMWAYYLLQWLRVGRDPKPGVIIPQYEAPEGCTPGMLRHVERMAYDDRCFAADLVDLAVRGRVEIRKDGGDYSLLRKSSGTRDALPAPEAGIAARTCSAQRSTLELKQSRAHDDRRRAQAAQATR